MVVDVVIADPQPDDDRIARYLCQPEQCPAVGAGEAPGHRVVPADPVDAQCPGPRCSASMCPSVQGGTQQLMDRSGEHLAVLVRKAPEIRQEARRPDVLQPSEPRSASSASMESYAFPSGASSPGRDGYLTS